MKNSPFGGCSFFGASYFIKSDYIVPKLFLTLLFLGCSHVKATKSAEQDWRAANIHKVAVVCVHGDRMTNRRVESSVVPKLRHQGFDAVAAQDLFPAAPGYSPKGLMSLMRGARVDGIVEVIYSGEVPPGGLPREVRFKYHSIKSPAANLSDHLRPLDMALIALMGA